jgi:hypothetical protein
MIALYHLDMVWQQKQKEEPKKSPGHTTGRVKQQKHLFFSLVWPITL